MEKFYQACHARTDFGWETINISSDIPSHILAFFESVETGNNVQRSEPKDLNGNPLWMLELICNGQCIGLVRVQYGLRDVHGRPNRFSQGFLFSNVYDLLKNPNNILGISDTNYQVNGGFPAVKEAWEQENALSQEEFSGHEALKLCIERSREIPSQLEMAEEMTAERALQACGMQKNQYVQFIKCVYYALSTRTKNTIYVQTDGTDRMARNLLFLVYTALPYSLRCRVTASTCPEISGQDKMLVFCKDLPANERFVNPVSGDNNILTPILERRWARNPFITFFAENYDSSDVVVPLLADMEQWLSKMGDASMNAMDALQLAFDMSMLDVENLDDSEVAGYLFDWLALPIANSKEFETCICCFLQKAIDRKVKLSEESERLLKDRVEKALTEELRDLYYQYLSFSISIMKESETSLLLQSFEKNADDFIRLKQNLLKSSNGIAVINRFYLDKIARLMKKQCTRDDLKAAYEMCKDLPGIVCDVSKQLSEKDELISLEELRSGIGYPRVFQNFYNTEVIWNKECRIPRAFLDEFDRLFREQFDDSRMNEYVQFYHTYSAYPKSEEFLDCLKNLQSGEYILAERFFETQAKFSDLTPSMKKALLDCAIKSGAADKCVSFGFWSALREISFSGKTLIELMAKYHVRLLFDANCLKKSLNTDTEYWNTTQKIGRFFRECKKFLKAQPDYTIQLQDSYAVLQHVWEMKREDDEKRELEKQKKQKAAEKERKKLAKKEHRNRDFLDIGEIDSFERRYEGTLPKSEIASGEYMQEQAARDISAVMDQAESPISDLPEVPKKTSETKQKLHKTAHAVAEPRTHKKKKNALGRIIRWFNGDDPDEE